MEFNPARQAVGQDAELTEVILRDNDACHKLQIVTSATPFDPRLYSGWLIRQVNVGWLAVRLPG